MEKTLVEKLEDKRKTTTLEEVSVIRGEEVSAPVRSKRPYKKRSGNVWGSVPKGAPVLPGTNMVHFRQIPIHWWSKVWKLGKTTQILLNVAVIVADMKGNRTITLRNHYLRAINITDTMKSKAIKEATEAGVIRRERNRPDKEPGVSGALTIITILAAWSDVHPELCPVEKEPDR